MVGVCRTEIPPDDARRFPVIQHQAHPPAFLQTRDGGRVRVVSSVVDIALAFQLVFAQADQGQSGDSPCEGVRGSVLGLAGCVSGITVRSAARSDS